MSESAQLSDSESLAAFVLAAGAGTRMRSAIPKPLHEVAGCPMLEHVLRAVESLDPDTIAIVSSPDVADHIQNARWSSRATVVLQDPPRGTGDAVRRAMREVSSPSHTLVVYSDHPLVQAEDLLKLANSIEPGIVLSLLTCVVDDPTGYGRIARSTSGEIEAIVEQVNDDPVFRSGPTEINTGIMVLETSWALGKLESLEPNSASGEILLTDLVAAAVEELGPGALRSVSVNPEVAMGVNDRVQLSAVDEIMRSRIRESHMRNGVTMIRPDSILIDVDVVIGADTTLYPGAFVGIGATIGAGCRIGPSTTIERSRIGEGVVVESSVVRDSEVGQGSHVGPFSHLRAGSVISADVHIGNFVETKNSTLEPGVMAGHFSYLGDASIGSETNIGAGTITCNFDGVEKHRTIIGKRVFIGSDSMLVAPVSIGDDAATGAGSVVTKDVPAGSLVVGMPARSVRRNQPSSGAEAGED